MIFLSKTSIDDPGSNLRIRNYQVTGEYSSTARISRAQTLDGGGVLSHYGTSVTDRDLPIDCRVTDTEAAALRQLHESGVLIRISFWEGAFSGYIYRLNIRRDGVTQITFYFTEKLTS